MKKVLSFLLACLLLVTAMASLTSALAAGNDEIVDGRFVETKKITVEVYERGNDGGTPPESNVFAQFIKEGMLRDHNVEVTFVPVGRWVEDVQIVNLLAAGDAPDVCVTYSYPAVQSYANMGGVLDLAPYLEAHKDLLPNLWGLLGDYNIYYDRDPNTGTLWAIEALLKNNLRVNTFVREDWLKKLNIAEPTTPEAFEAMLVAFKDNAELLLGADADKMIPFSTSFDISWRESNLLISYVPEALTEKDKYINGFDDRHFTQPGIKEGVRKLNEWYNKGLVWKDFALYGAGDKTEDNLLKAGYVGAFMHNWDYPYRDGQEGIHANLKKLVGEDAAFIAVDPFTNDAGIHRKFLSSPVDRKVFFPATNDEPLASLLYLDWISKFENRSFLQIGNEGINHEVLADGTVKSMPAVAPDIMNSPNNIDYTMTINGLDLGDMDLNIRSLALGYAGVEARFIEKAYILTQKDARYGQQVNVGNIVAEEGMGPALKEKRDALLNQAVTAPVDKFDEVFDSGMADYQASGGQAIVDERTAAWARFFE